MDNSFQEWGKRIEGFAERGVINAALLKELWASQSQRIDSQSQRIEQLEAIVAANPGGAPKMPLGAVELLTKKQMELTRELRALKRKLPREEAAAAEMPSDDEGMGAEVDEAEAGAVAGEGPASPKRTRVEGNKLNPGTKNSNKNKRV